MKRFGILGSQLSKPLISKFSVDWKPCSKWSAQRQAASLPATPSLCRLCLCHCHNAELFFQHYQLFSVMYIQVCFSLTSTRPTPSARPECSLERWQTWSQLLGYTTLLPTHLSPAFCLLCYCSDTLALHELISICNGRAPPRSRFCLEYHNFNSPTRH